MAYNEDTVQKIRDFFLSRKIKFVEKKMFSGICFMIDDKLCCGTHVEKKTGENVLLCRISDEVYEKVIEDNYVEPMKMGERTAMKNWVFVSEEGYKTLKQLHKWLQLCLDYNPIAKSSKKK